MKHKKIILGSVLSIVAVATPIVVSTSCGEQKKVNLLAKNKGDIDTLTQKNKGNNKATNGKNSGNNKGNVITLKNKNGGNVITLKNKNGIDLVSHKMIDKNVEKNNISVDKEISLELNKIKSKNSSNPTWTPSTWKPKQASGDKTIIDLFEKMNFKDFWADQNFVKNSNGVFQRSPKTIISDSPQVSDINNLEPMLFGMQKLKDAVKSKNGQLNVSLIPRTENDSNGTLGVKAKVTINGKSASKEYIVRGFTITKDIFMNGNKFKTVGSIIRTLNAKTHMGFEKNVAIMTPQDLKNELIDLYNDTFGGRLTIIGLYNGKISAISLDRHQMLKDLIFAFGDVSKVKRYDGKWMELGFSLLTSPGSVDTGSLLQLFSEYSKDLDDKKKNDVAGLLGNAPAKVMNMFPDLLKLFSQVSDGVKKMDMVNEWAIDKGFKNDVSQLNHILVQWVLSTGKLK